MVLIDMDKPTNCIDCPLRLQSDCMINKKSRDYETYEEQYRHCPLREVQG